MACFLVWVFLPWLGTDYLGWFYSQYTALYSFANLFPRVFMLWANIGYSFHCLTTLALWWVSMVYGIFVFRFDLFDLLVGLAFHFSWIAFYVNEFCAFFYSTCCDEWPCSILYLHVRFESLSLGVRNKRGLLPLPRSFFFQVSREKKRVYGLFFLYVYAFAYKCVI